MDKHQATDYTITRLQAGYQAEEITEELSRLLKAPIERVRPFVNQVATSHPDIVKAPQPDPVSDLGEALSPPITSHEAEQPAPANDNMVASGFSDLPPGLQAIVKEAQTTRDDFAKSAPVSKPKDNQELPLPRQAKFAASPEKEESDVDLEALSEFAFQQLKKQRRHNDIVEDVCRKTGWHWNKSQRFVARVQTKHHDELQSSKNRVTMIVGVGIVLAGLIVALNGIGALSDYAKLAVFAKTNPEVLLDIAPSAIFLALSATVTGIGMVLGGGYGIARALTSR
jgi:hypothetical protein